MQTHMDSSNPGDQAAEFHKLRHQHAQLLAFNHVLVEENNHHLVDHAELVSEVKFQTANWTTFLHQKLHLPCFCM